MAVFAAGCSDGPADPTRIDGAYSGASAAYAEASLEIDRTDEEVSGTLRLRTSAGTIVFDGAVSGAFWSPTQFSMQGIASVGGESQVLSLEGVVVAQGLAITITSTWLEPDTIILRRD
jgi:hypothetical protein